MARSSESSGLHSLAALRAEAEQAARVAAQREAARWEHERELTERARNERENAHRAENDALGAQRREALARSEELLAQRAELTRAAEHERELRRSVELAATRRFLAQRLLSVAATTSCLASWLLGAVLYFGFLRPHHEQSLHELRQSLIDEQAARHQEQRTRQQLVAHAATPTPALETPERLAPRNLPAPAPVKPHGPSRPIPGRNASIRRDDGDPLNPCLKR